MNKNQLKLEYDLLKERYEKQEERYNDYYSKFNGKEVLAVIGITIFFTVMLGLAIFVFAGAFDDPIKELNIDKSILAKNYVIQSYPEYKDCIFEYYNCFNKGGNCNEGVKIYCNDLPDERNGLTPLEEKRNPDYKLLFKEGIDLNYIFKEKLESCGLNLNRIQDEININGCINNCEEARRFNLFETERELNKFIEYCKMDCKK